MMKKCLLLLLLFIGFSCKETKEKPIKAAISCGQCQLGLTNQKGCDLAIRIDGKAYFIDGAHIDDFGDAHDKNTGFCEVVRTAEVTGVLDNNRFKATSIKLVDKK